MGVRIEGGCDDESGLSQRQDLGRVAGRVTAKTMTKQDQWECTTGNRSILDSAAGTCPGIPDIGGEGTICTTSVVESPVT